MDNNTKYVLISTKETNRPTVQVIINYNKYLLYSKYNPTRDSKIFAEEFFDKNIENYLVYGLGLGYHINELEDLVIKVGKKYNIYVVECNDEIIDFASDSVDLSRIFKNPNIKFINIKNDKKSYDKLKEIIAIDNIKIAIHSPSLNIII